MIKAWEAGTPALYPPHRPLVTLVLPKRDFGVTECLEKFAKRLISLVSLLGLEPRTT